MSSHASSRIVASTRCGSPSTPTSRQAARRPTRAEVELPEEYRRTYDPFVALTAAAAVTTRLGVGTGICLVAQHDPIVLAKTIASLDQLSDGRFMFGIGVGWNIEEMVDHGVDPKHRRAVVREKVLTMKALWTEDEGAFHGEFVDFEPAWSWPKPVQRPHPPVIMGGAGGPITFRHVIEYCDGWMPMHGRRKVLEGIAALRIAAEAAGRDPATIELGVFGVPADPGVLETYREAGVSRCLIGLPSESADSVLPLLDQHSALLGT